MRLCFLANFSPPVFRRGYRSVVKVRSGDGNRSADDVADHLLKQRFVEETEASWIRTMTPARAARIEEALLKRNDAVCVLLNGARMNPFDAAAVVRSCDAFGIQNLFLVPNAELTKNDRKKFRVRTSEPQHVSDVKLSRQIKKATAGVEKWLTIHQPMSVELAASSLKSQGFQVLSMNVDRNLTPSRSRRTPLREINFERKTVVCLGLSAEEEQAFADYHATLPNLGVGNGLTLSIAAAVSLSIVVKEVREQRGGQNFYLPPAEKRSICTAWRAGAIEPRKLDPEDIKFNDQLPTGLSKEQEKRLLEGGLFQSGSSIAEIVKQFSTPDSLGCEIKGSFVARRRTVLSQISLRRRRELMYSTVVGLCSVLAKSSIPGLESVDLHLVKNWFKIAIKSVNENFMKNCFDEAGNPVSPYTGQAEERIAQANWRTPEAALTAVEELCCRMGFDSRSRFISHANRSDAITIVARIFKQPLLDGEASVDVHERAQRIGRSYTMEKIPLGYPYKRELWQKWTQLLEEDIDYKPQSSPDLDALELAIRLQQCAYCAAQLHTCIWERVARGRCTKRLRSKRLAPLESALVEGALEPSSVAAREEDLLPRLSCELLFDIASLQLALERSPGRGKNTSTQALDTYLTT
ncbi:hypothetical protein NDN08_007806 [Rhodosorus marinus]|uniref:Uncharacterized protein n=1 Tax=Rhodosorus marinus TaxID=101924 RepID=A0AAV8UYK7_9RHOD|nr:hypothetical protein NDN08_007806 [Rhodosorus marinus]